MFVIEQLVMGYNTKALNYCGTHTHVFLKKNCKNCGQGMCGECIDNHEHFCPECVVQLSMQSSTYKAKKKVLFSTLVGIIALLLYTTYSLLSNSEVTPVFVWWHMLLAFCLGVSAMATYYLLSTSQDFNKHGKLPFIGLKLYFIFLILFTISLIPIGFYVYWLLLFIIGLTKRKKTF